MRINLIVPVMTLLAFSCFGNTLKLTENGKTLCSIVLAQNANPAEKHAADELAKYIALISGGKRPLIGTGVKKGFTPIYLKKIPDKATGEQGFRVTAGKGSLTVDAASDCGILFGIYHILRRYGKARWLIPGKDGEYLRRVKTIALPLGSYIEKPHFRFRYYIGAATAWNSARWESWDWSLRNGIRIEESKSIINYPSLKEGLRKRAAFTLNGSHVFSYLLTGRGALNIPNSKYRAHVDKLFAEHPEYFPLINGKRVPVYHCGAEPQPCTSNPEVIKRFVRHLLMIRKASPKESVFWFMNNDLPKWCECKECVKQDPPDEKKAGNVSTRYWKLLNRVLKEARKEIPDIQISAVSYQNYSLPPTGVKPDRGVYNVMISNHRRCWKHHLTDPNCAANKWYLNYNKVWNEIGLPIFTWEECYVFGRDFIPSERAIVETLKFYHKNMKNIQGFRTETTCPDGIFNKPRNTFANMNNWFMMWQSLYMSAAFQWNAEQDYEKVYEEINSLYYGKGWKGGMKKFRKLMEDAYYNSAGCYGYGHSVMTGKFMDRIGLEKELLAALEAAGKAAEKDPDPRALQHVKRDRLYFQKTWIKNYKEYVANSHEIQAFPLKKKIVLDGKLDEIDWKNAEVVTRFKRPDGTPAKYETMVKITYDSENIYFGIEMEEPAFQEQRAEVKKHDGPVWEDSTIEIFLNPPMQGGTCFQMIFNKKGVLFDCTRTPGARQPDSKFDSNAVMKASWKKDRWFAEIRIPVRPILGTQLKAGEVIKANVFRTRNVGKKDYEYSSWCASMPHNSDVFRPVTFVAQRTTRGGNRGEEINTSFWRNGSFKELHKKPYIPKHWKWSGPLPRFWHLSQARQYGGEGAYLKDKLTGQMFLRLKGGFIFQFHKIRSKKIKVVCRVRGKGSVDFGSIRYAPKMKKYLGVSFCRKEVLKDTSNWKTIAFEYNRPGKTQEEQSFCFWPAKGTLADVAEIYLVPVNE